MTKNQVSLRQSIGCLDLTFKVNITPYSAGLKISQKIKKIKKKEKLVWYIFYLSIFSIWCMTYYFLSLKKKKQLSGKTI